MKALLRTTAMEAMRHVGATARRTRWYSVTSVLVDRSLIEISGPDAKVLLQGLITNDMALLDQGAGKECISTAFLTPKGRVLGDALVIRSPKQEMKGKPGYLLDCPLSIATELQNHIELYKLRSKAKIKDVTPQFEVVVSSVNNPWGNAGAASDRKTETEAPRKGTFPPVLKHGEEGQPVAAYNDPRFVGLGQRLLLPKADTGIGGRDWLLRGEEAVIEESHFNALRILFGVPEGLELSGSIPLESNLELLGSVSFTKGCYVGQELTARTHFKGSIRKRLLPVILTPLPQDGEEHKQGLSPGPVLAMESFLRDEGVLTRWTGDNCSKGEDMPLMPPVGTPIVEHANQRAKMGSLVAVSPVYNVGLALLRLEALLSPENGQTLDYRLEGPVEEHGLRCSPIIPDWWPANLNPKTGKVVEE